MKLMEEMLGEFVKKFGELFPEEAGLREAISDSGLEATRECLKEHAALDPDFVLVCLEWGRQGDIKVAAEHAKACKKLLDLLGKIDTMRGRERGISAAGMWRQIMELIAVARWRRSMKKRPVR